jgi:type II secretion system protein L
VCGAEELGRHSLLLYAGPTDWHKRSDQVDALRERFLTVKVQLLPQGPLPLLAQQLPHVKPTNLLQGEFAPTAHRGGAWRDWRMAAVLAFLMLATFVGGRFWELSSLKNNEATVDARLAELGQALLPPGSVPSDPAQLRASMAQRLGGTRGDPNDVMLEILAALAQARMAAPQTRIESARFRDGALELKLRADTADSIEKINAQLRANGWQAELLSGAANGTAFEGRVRIAGIKST